MTSCLPHPQLRSFRPRSRRTGVSLVEVMVGTLIFSILAISLTAALIQNYKVARVESYRTQVLTSTIGIVEQLRAQPFKTLEDIYNNNTTKSYKVQIIDPLNYSASSGAPVGYKQFDLPINVKDGTEVNSTWTTVDIPLDTDGKLRIQLRYWLDVKLNLSSAGKKCDVYEAKLVYQWRRPGDTKRPWQSGAYRIAVPWLNPSLDSL